ncbi:MAG: DUF192 domain-containing protein [Polymorphobacter sp.]
MINLRYALALLLAALAAPSMAATCPNTGLQQQAAVLVTAKGRFKYQLEVAASVDEQSCGMMFRKTMKRTTGMVFPFVPARPASFWMDNTALPLDLIFVAPNDRVLSIGNGKPFSRDLIDSGGVTAAVIELTAGEAARIGLKPGDKVER